MMSAIGSSADNAAAESFNAALNGQRLPLDAGVQDERDVAQDLPVRHPRSSWTHGIAGHGFGQQRLDALPQPVRHDPRRLFTTPHGRRC